MQVKYEARQPYYLCCRMAERSINVIYRNKVFPRRRFCTSLRPRNAPFALRIAVASWVDRHDRKLPPPTCSAGEKWRLSSYVSEEGNNSPRMMKYSAYAAADSTCLRDNFGKRVTIPAEFNRSLIVISKLECFF